MRVALPSKGVPSQGLQPSTFAGSTPRELMPYLRQFTAKKTVVGMDIVEYNPSRDLNNMTAMVAARLCKEIIAKVMKGENQDRLLICIWSLAE